MKINLNYKGLIKYGNLGDDIFLPLVIKLFKDNLITKGLKFNNLKTNNTTITNDTKIVNIMGGGSLIHPKQTSFTEFKKDHNIVLMLGTGMTDCNFSKITSDNVCDFISDMKNFTFTHKNIKQNLENLKHFQNKNKLYGGCRGLYENYIFDSNGMKLKHINDLGLIAHILEKEVRLIQHLYSLDTIKFTNFPTDRKIILINPCNIFGIDAFKDKNMNYISYNSYINNILIKFSVFLINNGYSILILPFDNRDNKCSDFVHNSIKKQLNKDQYKFIYKIYNSNIINYLHIIKHAYIAIGIRLHCNIICNSFLIPTINISYGVKGINYSVTNNLEKYIIPTFSKHLTFDKLKHTFNKVQNKYNQIQTTLQENKNNTHDIINKEIKKLILNYDLNKYKHFDIIIDNIKCLYSKQIFIYLYK